jgi:hypothetical protein
MPEPLECEQIDTLFIESEQAVTRGLITKKMVAKNAYYGKVPDGGQFPLNSGTRIKGLRLGRIGMPNLGTGWRPVEDEACTTNACDWDPEVISHGHSDYFFSLVQKDLRTDWVCIDSLAFRSMPEQELAHLEDGIRNISRAVHEEFRRSRFLLFGRNKLLALVGEDGEGVPNEAEIACSDAGMLTNGYVFETRANGEMDENHVRVRVDPVDVGLERIAELSLDMLDFARARLAYEEDSYLEGTNLFDTLLPDPNMSNKLALQENERVDSAASNGVYNGINLSQDYGTERVLRKYAMRDDIHAMRFYPDVAFNEDLVASEGYAYDDENPETWPRMVRVHAYKPVKSKVAGVEFVLDPAYLRAPFGITTIMQKEVMSVMSFPNVQRVGNAAKVGGFGYEGTAQWQNPDWPCNVNRDKGFWKLRFRLAAKQEKDELGYSWFHRVDKSIRLVGNKCSLPTNPAIEAVTPYCYEGLGGPVDSGLGVNAAIGN